MNVDISCFDLLAFYAVTFGLMNKITFAYNKVGFFDRMFECSYCTGFHAGWIVYILKCKIYSSEIAFLTLLYFSLVSASSSFIIDKFTDWLEE